METLTLDLPTLYGDHHVINVRRMVAALPGVEEVWASAARQQITVSFDPARLSPETIETALTENGYPPGEVLQGLSVFFDELHHVLAMEHAEAAPAKYAPPSAFGACPGLEPRVISGEHPADKHG
jgi:copper chaperone CopZ